METVKEKILMTVKEACELTGIGVNSMYVLINKKGCPIIAVGRKKLIVRNKFVTWLENEFN